MGVVDVGAIRHHIAAYARPVDAARVAVWFGDGLVDALLDELAAFQNADGGFGHRLEPDFRARDSTPFTTSVALQYVTGLDTAVDSPLVRDALRYLRATYRPDRRGWLAFDPSIDISPSAPWWESSGHVEEWTDWGNPSAELLGYLYMLGDADVDASLIESVSGRALERLDEIARADAAEFHELICYRDLHANADSTLQSALWPQLSELVRRAVDPDPANWASYSATPLTYVDAPDSPFTDVFEPSLIEADLDRLTDGIVDGDHWEPNWTWGEHHPDVWSIARAEWIGVVAVRNLIMLARFGRV